MAIPRCSSRSSRSTNRTTCCCGRPRRGLQPADGTAVCTPCCSVSPGNASCKDPGNFTPFAFPIIVDQFRGPGEQVEDRIRKMTGAVGGVNATIKPILASTSTSSSGFTLHPYGAMCLEGQGLVC